MIRLCKQKDHKFNYVEYTQNIWKRSTNYQICYKSANCVKFQILCPMDNFSKFPVIAKLWNSRGVP